MGGKTTTHPTPERISNCNRSEHTLDDVDTLLRFHPKGSLSQESPVRKHADEAISSAFVNRGSCAEILSTNAILECVI